MEFNYDTSIEIYVSVYMLTGLIYSPQWKSKLLRILFNSDKMNLYVLSISVTNIEVHDFLKTV